MAKATPHLEYSRRWKLARAYAIIPELLFIQERGYFFIVLGALVFIYLIAVLIHCLPNRQGQGQGTAPFTYQNSSAPSAVAANGT